MTINLHMFLQAKGGVGKSFCACMLAQYLLNKGTVPSVYDSDPSNQSLLAFKGLNAKYVDVLQNRQTVAVGGMDRFFEFLDYEVLRNTDDQMLNVILDIGASNFIPTCSFLVANKAFDYFKDAGFHVYFHMPFIGGDARRDCLSCFNDLAQQLPEGNYIIWINNFPSKVFKGADSIEDFADFANNRDKVRAVINLPEFEESTSGKTLKYFLDSNKLFSEADDVVVGGKGLTAFDKFRAKNVANELYAAISVIDSFLF